MSKYVSALIGPNYAKFGQGIDYHQRCQCFTFQILNSKATISIQVIFACSQGSRSNQTKSLAAGKETATAATIFIILYTDK